MSALLVIAPSPVLGQTELRFIVADSVTGEPIAGALIELLGPDGTSVWRGLTGDGGLATADVHPGPLSVLTMMLGYVPVGPAHLHIPDQDWLRLRVLLSPAPVELDDIAVDVRSRRWPRAADRWGFDWRKVRRPFGEFLVRGDQQLLNAPTLSSLLRRISGFLVQDRYTGNPAVFMNRSRWLRVDGSFTMCGPTLILNGSTMDAGGRGSPVIVDDYVRMEEIEALEIYGNPAEVPPEFRYGANTCGAIVIWTY